jgi:hypothetical protein
MTLQLSISKLVEPTPHVYSLFLYEDFCIFIICVSKMTEMYSNALDSYLRYVWFKSEPGHWKS